MTRPLSRIGIGALAALGSLAPLEVAGQTDAQPEPLLDSLVQRFKTDPLSLGLLIQAVGTWAEGSDQAFRDGWVIGNARLLLYGRLDGGWSYLFQTNFAFSPAILDARIGYETGVGIRLDAGRFKTPVSREFLTYAGSIDFVDRSRAVALLAPGRQVGVQVSGGASTGPFWAAGVFSGPNSLGTEDALMAAGRLGATWEWPEDRSLSVAVNGGYGQDRGLARVLLFDDFAGEGWVGGFDWRYTQGRWLLASDLLATRFQSDDGAVDARAWGFHLTGGWMWTGNRQVLLRWDRWDDVAEDPDDAVLLGLNVWPTGATEIQVNYVLPVAGDVSRHRFLVNFQLGF